MGFTEPVARFLLRSSRMRRMAEKWRRKQLDADKRRMLFAVALSKDFKKRFVIKDKRDHHAEIVLFNRLMTMVEQRVNWSIVALHLLGENVEGSPLRRKRLRRQRPSTGQQDIE